MTPNDNASIYTRVEFSYKYGDGREFDNKKEKQLQSIMLTPEFSPDSKKIHFIIPDRYREAFVKLLFHLENSLADKWQRSCDEWVQVDELKGIDNGLGRTVLYINPKLY